VLASSPSASAPTSTPRSSSSWRSTDAAPRSSSGPMSRWNARWRSSRRASRVRS
jgi:hypothetical protein